MSTEAKSTILVVDDTPANLDLLEDILSGQGYEVRKIPSGQLALASVKAMPPDLILLDIRMPDVDGYEVCEQLKADERTRSVPVIFISALQDTSDKLQAFAKGGVDYVTKPFHSEEVLARVKTHLELQRLNRTLAALNAELEQKVAERTTELIEREVLINKLEATLEEIQILRRILPICSFCKSIRNDEGYYEQLEAYLYKHSGVDFSHTVCPTCKEKYYPKINQNDNDG